jgi:hypothetical protein
MKGADAASSLPATSRMVGVHQAKAGEPGEALHREPLDAGYVLRPLDALRRVLSWPARTGRAFWDRE